jgi:hypothetical protein
MSKPIHVASIGRKSSTSSRILARSTSAGTASTSVRAAGPARVTPASRSVHRTTSVLQCVDHCISRQPWSM